MNKTFYIIILLLLRGMAAMAQQTTGTATYEIRMAQNPGNFTLSEEDRRKLPLQVQLQLQASIAAAAQTEQLDFDGQKAWFHPGGATAVEAQSGGTQLNVSTKAEGYGQEVYRDLVARSEVNVATIAGKAYRVTETLTPLPWKLQQEVKEMAGHTCHKATLPGDPVRRIVNGKEEQLPATDIVAWYTTDIPVSQGPGRYYGLPGLVLQVDEGFRSISCTGIDMGTPQKTPMPPTTGKAVSKPEFEKLREAYVREMIGNGNGASQMIIRQN